MTDGAKLWMTPAHANDFSAQRPVQRDAGNKQGERSAVIASLGNDYTHLVPRICQPGTSTPSERSGWPSGSDVAVRLYSRVAISGATSVSCQGMWSLPVDPLPTMIGRAGSRLLLWHKVQQFTSCCVGPLHLDLSLLDRSVTSGRN